MRVGHYLELLRTAELDLASACERVASEHSDEPDVRVDCLKFANDCREHASKLGPFLERYPCDAEQSGAHCAFRSSFGGPRPGPFGLLRDLHDLYLGATECEVSWTLIAQAASGLRDRELLEVVAACEGQSETHAAWFKSRMKQAAPQTLVVVR